MNNEHRDQTAAATMVEGEEKLHYRLQRSRQG